MDARNRPPGPRWHVQVRFAKGPYAAAVFGGAAVAGLAGAWSGASYGGSLGGLAGLLATLALVFLAAHLAGRYALRWAAEQGHAGAQLNLGLMYAHGRGVAQDDAEAHMWFNLASSRFAGDDRESALKWRAHFAARLTPEQLAEAQRRAREWDAAHPREP